MKHEWPIDTKVGPVTQALIDGRRSLVANGWCQGSTLDYQGRHCAVGALRPFIVACFAVRELMAVLPHELTNVPAYNDLPTTTLADILALYDRAIARARSKGI